MDRMKIRFDNLDNELVQGDLRVLIERKFYHPWLKLPGMKSEILISGSTPKPDEDRQTGIAGSKLVFKERFN
ncbi:hypothetical protein EG328_011020 [Venturia inaequalis]|uniref:Uncharacterized protein n=1 Tax=Venturia inaequalis TaxID=5025 RepID=A0A8H3U680_VENIN|nr:hypothetical protein EG328_011020 [Venturia inaequalis]